jgi:hypothetical protein
VYAVVDVANRSSVVRATSCCVGRPDCALPLAFLWSREEDNEEEEGAWAVL